MQKCQKNNINFLLGRMYFTRDDGYQNFSVFAPMVSSVILACKKVTKWLSTGISSEKIKPFDTNLVYPPCLT